MTNTKKYNKILLVEDNQTLGYALSEYLKLHGFDVEWAKVGSEAKAKFNSENFHLILLDVMLPVIDGFELAGHMKLTKPEIPILFITAKNHRIDEIKAFKLGADDFLVKPIHEELLIFRINAVLNRVYRMYDLVNQEKFICNGFEFDPQTNSAFYQGNSLNLTNIEAEILGLLCARAPQTLEKKVLMMKIWGNADEYSQKSLDVHLVNLRKKTRILVNDEMKIINVRGKGYSIVWKRP